MKELIQRELSGPSSPAIKKLVLAETLQHLLLRGLYHHGFFDRLVFTGGTALRLLYRLGRFSAGLDFSLPGGAGFDGDDLLQKLAREMSSQQLPFESSPKKERNVWQVLLKFPGLLHDFRLSPLKSQKLTVKMEVDTNPPEGGQRTLALVAAPVSYTVSVFDLPSLFATKLHAVFFRKYTKGRDFYDLMWYLGKRVTPNYPLLNQAIRQTQGAGHEIAANTLKARLLDRVATVDFSQVCQELERFIIAQDELKLFDRGLFEGLIERNC